MGLLKRLLGSDSSSDFAWLFSANAKALQALQTRLPPVLAESLQACKNEKHFLASSTRLSASGAGGDADPALSVFAAPNLPKPELLVIGRELNLLLNNDFTLAWLAWRCSCVSENGRVFAELPASARERGDSPRLLARDIERCDDAFSCSALGDSWYEVALTTEFRNQIDSRGFEATAARFFRSIAGPLLERSVEFVERYSSAHESYKDSDRLKPEFAARQYVYTLHGASQKSAFISWLVKHHGLPGHCDILDMGGGYGAMAVELACQGHQVSVLELEQAKIEHLGEWIAQISQGAESVSFTAGDFDRIDSMTDSFDLISFFGSLLYYPHDRCEDLLRRCARRLKPGGLLVVHENPKERAAKDAVDYDNQFTVDELETVVRSVFDDLQYYSIFSYQTITADQAKNSLIVLSARKRES